MPEPVFQYFMSHKSRKPYAHEGVNKVNVFRKVGLQVEQQPLQVMHSTLQRDGRYTAYDAHQSAQYQHEISAVDMANAPDEKFCQKFTPMHN